MNGVRLTPARRRALQAVRDGKVLRVRSKDGDVYRGPSGVGGQALWRLAAYGLICSGDATSKWSRDRAVELTDAGRLLLSEAPAPILKTTRSARHVDG